MALPKITKKYFLLIIIMIILFLAAAWWLIISSQTRAPQSLVRLGGKDEVKVDIVTTPEAQFQGLSGRKSLCANCGMLFKFDDKAKRTFVMRNMKFPLDILWISDGIIVGAEENVKPEGEKYLTEYISPLPVNNVLELPAGYVARHGLALGARFELLTQ